MINIINSVISWKTKFINQDKKNKKTPIQYVKRNVEDYKKNAEIKFVLRDLDYYNSDQVPKNFIKNHE